jgi:hypothetical protein
VDAVELLTGHGYRRLASPARRPRRRPWT